VERRQWRGCHAGRLVLAVILMVAWWWGGDGLGPLVTQCARGWIRGVGAGCGRSMAWCREAGLWMGAAVGTVRLTLIMIYFVKAITK
jgi:hypothetical protein